MFVTFDGLGRFCKIQLVKVRFAFKQSSTNNPPIKEKTHFEPRCANFSYFLCRPGTTLLTSAVRKYRYLTI
ncbi:hypothetical protein HUJ04_012565 [Dendroctonus ponderosae]|nr:hypothetical protein HUJ04_012565 [Dendroctonus ponderosae]